MVGKSDCGPVFWQTFNALATETETLKDSETLDGAERLEWLIREQARISIMGIPDDVATALSFQVATGIVAQFTLDMGEMVQSGVLLPEIQALVDQAGGIEIAG